MTRRERTEKTLTEKELRVLGVEDVPKALRTVRDLAGQGVTDDDLAPLLPLLQEALRASPDPDRALSSFARWFAAVGSRYSHLQMLLHHPVALDLFCLITGSSQYFADLLARQPEYFEIIANPGVRGGTKTAAALTRDASALVDVCRLPELKRDALRRWKAREMLRIGVRDLVGLADMPATAREFSNLAAACVQKACDIAAAMLPVSGQSPLFAVIGMGKLGGQELNYSSDIDLMFVHGDDLPTEVVMQDGRRMETTTWLRRMAETLISVLSEESANGHVFRVDMRLRPEGRFGALTRSLSSYRAYYESWAESWERQALLKARFIAGDRALGEAFLAMIEPFVYRRYVSPAFLEDLRANKRRIEQKCALEDQTLTNIKTGYGGIRDVEFLVQRLQLAYGGVKPRLRTPNTLAALQRLHHARLLTDTEAHDLADDYRFLRTLEHRLQLLHGFQTQTLPPATAARERLSVARRMGYLSGTAFEADLQRRRDRVHAYLERLFYPTETGPDAGRTALQAAEKRTELRTLLDNIEAPAAQERLALLLRAGGFHDIPAALRALQLPMRGNEFGEMPPDTAVEFKAIAGPLLELLAHSADPDVGLAGMEAIALAVPNRAQLYAALDDSPEILQRLVLLAAGAPPLFRRLARHLEWMETLLNPETDPKSLGNERASAVLTLPFSAADPFAKAERDSVEIAGAETEGVETDAVEKERREEKERAEKDRVELWERVQGAKGAEAKLETIARFYQRETLRIGAQDVWDEVNVNTTLADLTRLAESVLHVLLACCAESLVATHAEPAFARDVLDSVAIIGLGKLGGAELGYGSDWDMVFVYDLPRSRGGETRGAERFGLVNMLVQRMIAASKELVSRGAPVEMDLRLRPWGRKGALIQTLRGFLDYHRTTGETWERQAALKARFVAGNPAVGRRMERLMHAVSYGQGLTEVEEAAIQAMKRRIETERLKPGEQATDLKLGYGGLSDIEWLTQRLQLQHGRARWLRRDPNTLRALSALAAARLLDNAEADLLTATYMLLTRLRNALWLQTGTPQDVLPAEPRRRRALARLLGYLDDAHAPAETRLWEDLRAQMTETRRIFQQRFYTSGPV